METTVTEKPTTEQPAEPKFGDVRAELKADPDRLGELIADLPDYHRTETIVELRDPVLDQTVLAAFTALAGALSKAKGQDLQVKGGASWEIVRPSTQDELEGHAISAEYTRRYHAWKKATQA